jgi:hypothetical protein
MGVFKEEAHTFENVAKKQTRIYNDAADYGYPYNTKKPTQDIKDLMRSIKTFKELDAQYPGEEKFIRNREEWDDGVSVDVIIFWEEDEGYLCGTKYHILFQKTENHPSKIDKEYNAFISVDAERYKEKA